MSLVDCTVKTHFGGWFPYILGWTVPARLGQVIQQLAFLVSLVHQTADLKLGLLADVCLGLVTDVTVATPRIVCRGRIPLMVTQVDAAVL